MISGFLNVYKPAGISSNSVVMKIKKILGIKRIGHTGTLDPLACGVLPVCIGSATKFSEYMLNNNKTYNVKLKFGILTDTYDSEGRILKTDDDIKFSKSDLNCVLKGFIGEYIQTPPKFSALKINGKRAYDLARKGVEFEIKPRSVKILSIENMDFCDNECSFTVECSKGTYIRSLCKDIGDRLDTYATMIYLERICSGSFRKYNSLDFNNINKESILRNLVSIDKVFNIPKLYISDTDFLNLIVNGVCVKNPYYIDKIDKGLYFLYNGDVLKGLCERNSDYFKMIKFLS